MIKTGDRLPDATLLEKTDDGPAQVELGELLKGRKVVLFGLPGAFTPTCSSAHLPSFMRTADDFRAKGVDEIVCLSVNDIHVMRLWGEQSGAIDKGIRMLADGDGALARAMGLAWSNPDVGFHDRFRRFAMLVEDGVVTAFHLDEMGVCAITTGEAMLAELG